MRAFSDDRFASLMEEEIGSVRETKNISWWEKWSEGDAQEMSKYYAKLSSLLNSFIVSLLPAVTS